MGKIIGKDIFGRAILDYHVGNYSEDITTFSSIAGRDEMELPWLFRNFHEMPMLEQTAMQQSKGRVLDIGCGAGSHSLYLQSKNLTVKAIDISEGAIKTCKARGVKNAIIQNIWDRSIPSVLTVYLLLIWDWILQNIMNLIVKQDR